MLQFWPFQILGCNSLETYTCEVGIGVVLLEKDQPIAFLSKALGPKHREFSIYEKEFLALILAVESWRPYLRRQEFLIRTYHHSLSYLIEQTLHFHM